MSERGRRVERVWDSPRELGSVQSITAVGGTPISVLAGFSLTSAIMAAAAAGGIWRDVAVALFALAASAFIVALTLIVEAINYAADPGIRLTYHPEALVDEGALEEQRRRQREDEWLLDVYNRRINRATATGVIASLLGLAAALLTARVSWGVTAGVGVLVAATAVVALNAWGRGGRLFPGPAHVPAAKRTPPPLSGTGRRAMLGGARAGDDDEDD